MKNINRHRLKLYRQLHQTKRDRQARHAAIKQRYADGAKVKQLAQEYPETPKEIRKLVADIECAEPESESESEAKPKKPKSGRRRSKGRKGLALDVEKVQAIRAAYAVGDVSMATLAAKYAVSSGTISQVINRQIWTHVASTPKEAAALSKVAAANRYSRGDNANLRATSKQKLTIKQVKRIRKAYATGRYTMVELGAKYSVAPETIKNVVDRRSWKHVD